MKFHLVALLVSVLVVSVMAGCNGIQVVDNTYGPVGGQHIKVADDMEYLGNPDIYTKANCVNECPTFDNSNLRIRSDLFAKKDNEKLAEVCFIETRKIGSGFQWRPEYGSKVTYGDKEYAEYYVAASKMRDSYVMSYMNYLKSEGYDLDVTDVVGRMLVRNVTKRTKVVIFYGCSLDTIPAEKRDFNEASEFIKERFEERFVVAGS